MLELSFFIGKGGVGKTTVSAAYAVYRALQSANRRVLLVSTDPAHSLCDVLQVRLRDRVTPIALPGRARLHAWQVNAEKEFRSFLDKNREALLATVETGTIFSRQEIEPLLETTLPGLGEVAALLAVERALRSGAYEEIVVDTAPFGHTVRLLQLPQQFTRFLDFLEIAGSRDQILSAHFGGRVESGPQQFLREWRALVGGVRKAIGRDAQLFLVTTPEKFSLNESLRVTELLRASSLPVEVSAVVLNRAVVRGSVCKSCGNRAALTKAARTLLKQQFRRQPLYVGEDSGAPVLGIAKLEAFARHVFAGKRLQLRATAPRRVPEVGCQRKPWPLPDTRLSLVLGKGGVGKTTVSAGLGFSSRAKRPGRPVTVCSVDPAPSLDDIFQQEVGDEPEAVLGDPGFRAAEMDATAEFGAWVQGVKNKIDEALSGEQSGVHVELSFEQRLFSALLDIVPPGVDEVFAIFRILDLLADSSQTVVIDMAPTGHALELLRMPESMVRWSRLLLKTLAAHRRLALAQDVAVEIAEFGQRVRELASVLADRERARIWTVMLPEPLPDRETQRLQKQLDELQIAAGPLLVNRVLLAGDVGNCRRCRLARQWQMATLARLRRRRGSAGVLVVRNFPHEIAGKRGLRSLTSEIWQLA